MFTKLLLAAVIALGLYLVPSDPPKPTPPGAVTAQGDPMPGCPPFCKP